jgi:hypothetical protein
MNDWGKIRIVHFLKIFQDFAVFFVLAEPAGAFSKSLKPTMG